jgi:hypothetical protein
MPSWRRLKTAKSRLDAKWLNKLASEETVLTEEEAIAVLRGDDPRPLLIVRECDGCKNKEGDLLKRTLEDERFLLATPWFHCVKLDKDAHLSDHPYNKLFTGSIPPHVVLSSWDGKRIIDVSRAGQKEIWMAMQKVLRVSYKKSAKSAMKGLAKILEQYDALDEREEELLGQLALKEERGKTRRAEKIRNEIIDLESDRQEVIDKEEKLYDLKLKFVKERDSEKE